MSKRTSLRQNTNAAESEGELAARLQAIGTCDDVRALQQIIDQALLDISNNLRLMAAAYQRMRELNPHCELSIQLSRELRGLLKRIAEGLVLPELVGRLYATHSRLLSRARNLCPSDQKRIVSNEPFEVAELGTDDFRMVPPLEMTPVEIDQVFHDGDVQPLEAQRAWLRDQRFRQRASREADDADLYEVNRRKGIVHFKGVSFNMTRKQLAQLLADLER